MDVQEVAAIAQVPGVEIIQWCQLCNAAPAQGVLAVIHKGDTKATDMPCCQECVNKIPASQWLANQLGDHHV